MIVKHPWFGPKRIGWGWRPVSWEGWTATAVSAGVVAATAILYPGTLAALLAALGAVGALVVVCLLTGTRSE